MVISTRLVTLVYLSGDVKVINIFDIIVQTYVGTSMRISGWGSTTDGGPLSPLLRTAFVNGITNADCQQRYRPARLTVTPRMICATTLKVDVDTCTGDGGSEYRIHQQQILEKHSYLC